MARVVVGYVGTGRNRRAVFKDQGPARAHGGSLGGIAAPALPDKLLVGAMFSAEGSGSVERRQATEAQREVWRAEREGSAPPRPERLMHVQQKPAGRELEIAASRARGAAKAGFTPGATKPWQAVRAPSLLIAPGPSPVMPAPIEEVPVHPLPAVASLPPSVRESERTNIPASIPRAGDPDVLAPCEDCSHRVICRIRPQLTGALRLEARFRVDDDDPGFHDPAIRIVAVSLECDYYLQDAREGVTRAEPPTETAAVPIATPRPAPAARAKAYAHAPASRTYPAPVKPALGGGAVTMPPYLRRAVDAMVATKGDRAAVAEKLVITRDSINTALSAVRHGHYALTAAELAVVGSNRKTS